jgi:hypothetical protein
MTTAHHQTPLAELRRRLNTAKHGKYANIEANVFILEDEYSKNSTVTIADMIEILARRGTLAVNPDYKAFDSLWAEIPDAKRNEATEYAIADRLEKLGKPITVENVRDVVINPVSGEWTQFAKDIISPNQGWYAKQEELRRQQEVDQQLANEAAHRVQETQRMIQEITGYMVDPKTGKAKYPKDSDPNHFQRIYNQKISALKAMSFEQLTTAHNAIMAQRKLRKGPVEDVRAAVKTQSRTIAPVSAGIELVNPRTGKPFMGKKELKQFLGSLSRQEARDFFYFPDGNVSHTQKPRPGVEEAVTKILQGGN